MIARYYYDEYDYIEIEIPNDATEDEIRLYMIKYCERNNINVNDLSSMKVSYINIKG